MKILTSFFAQIFDPDVSPSSNAQSTMYKIWEQSKWNEI